MGDFITTLIGDIMPVGTFLGYLVIAILTSLVIMGINGNNKRKTSAKSPEQFSLGYLLYDNRTRIFTSLGIMALSIRFSPQLLNMEMTPWAAVIIGASVHVLAGVIKNISKQSNK